MTPCQFRSRRKTSSLLLPSLLLLVTALVPQIARGQENWVQQSPTTPPANSEVNGAMAWDGHEIVLFGGTTNSGFTNATYTWDGSQWTLQSLATSPSARQQAAMAYDPSHGVAVLFGGNGASGANADTWKWDGTTWTNVTPASNNPPARFAARMAYDAVNHVIVLYGGSNLNDIWTWDGTSWTQQMPQHTIPARSVAPVMAWDPVGQQILLYGGIASGVFQQDTWAWKNGDFTQLSPASNPGPRADSINNMVTDSANDLVGLFGGSGNSNGGAYNDTWFWNGTNWTQQTPANSPGPPIKTYNGRSNQAMGYDPANQQVVLFGGVDSLGDTLADTWLFGLPPSSLLNWMQQSPATSPSARNSPGMAYDSLHQKTVLFGGLNANGSVAFNDTWLWDGNLKTWTQATPAHNPPGRGVFGMAYDELHQQVVLFGGATSSSYIGDTWVWDGTDWTQKSPATSPSARSDFMMVYDEARQQIVLYGGGNNQGNALNDTWVWDGTNWTKKTVSTNPGNRLDYAMAYDSATQQVVLFGGQNNYQRDQVFSDTWTWNGTAWTKQLPVASPTTRLYHTMAYDAAIQQILLFSGLSSGGELPDTWAWNGTSWLHLMPATVPPARIDSSMAYDAGQQQIVMFGGDGLVFVNGATTLSDTWTYGASQTSVNITVPAGVQFTFNGTTYTGSQTINVAPGMYDLSTSSPQATGTGTQAVFTSWSDTGAQEHMVTVGTTSVNITGTFKTQYLLTTAVSPSGSGTITVGGYYDAGSQVTVIALASAGYTFSSWSGGACSSGSGFCIFNITGPATATANFTASKFLVTINVPAGIQYTLSGFPFTGSTSLSLPAGSYALALVSPQSTGVGSQAVFLSWSDGGAQSHNVVVTSAAVTVTGSFKMQYLLTVSVTPANEGSVTPGSGFYDAGATAIPIAFATAGYSFEFWNGACTGSSALCVVIMNAPESVTANFSIPLAWVQLFPANSPSGRQNSAMAYDAAHQQVVLFGGSDEATGNYVLGDTWIYDGVNWTQVFPATSPSGRADHVMAYDAARQRVVLFGGTGSSSNALALNNSETWLWDGSNWTLQHPATSPPASTFEFQSMAYDAALQETVLYGGASVPSQGAFVFYYDTWVWDGTNWTQKGSATPQINEGSIAYDSARQQIVLDSGGGGGTWVWDGTNWTEVSAFTPDNVFGVPIAYDALHQQTVLYDFGDPLQTWLWDGANWTQHSPALQPQGSYPPMVYDGARQDVLLFTGTYPPQTWVWIAPSVNLVPQAPTVVNDGVGDYLVTVTLKNQGNVPISLAFITSATLGGNAATGFTTPVAVGPINPGGTGSFTAKFPVSKFNSITTPAIAFQGTYNAGTVVGAKWTASTRGGVGVLP